MALMAWGDTWAPGSHGPLVELVHSECGQKTRPGLYCNHCADTLSPAQLHAGISPAYLVSSEAAETP
jgi:hypothetical protein